MCMRDCEHSDDHQMCRNRCSDSMSGSYDSYRGSFNKGYGWGNFEMCMRDCDRREDSNDRQMCRNKCYDSMFESDHFNRDSMSDSGHFDREDGFERSYGSGNYEMCMRDCD